MIAAGFGMKRGADASQLVAALDAALARDGVERSALGALAAPAPKAKEPGLAQLATRLGLPLRSIDVASLQQADARCLTRSQRSLDALGVGSAAEAAALAAAGPDSRLTGPRLVLGPVTCALASGGDSP